MAKISSRRGYNGIINRNGRITHAPLVPFLLLRFFFFFLLPICCLSGSCLEIHLSSVAVCREPHTLELFSAANFLFSVIRCCDTLAATLYRSESHELVIHSFLNCSRDHFALLPEYNDSAAENVRYFSVTRRVPQFRCESRNCTQCVCVFIYL